MDSKWTRDSWRKFPITQQPNWQKNKNYQRTICELYRLPSLVFSGETRNLLKDLSDSDTFILQVGNCAESFSDCNGPKIHDYLKIFLQMSMIIEFLTGKKIVKIGRIAGQYAKPRSNDSETIDGVTYPCYRGDIVNSDSLDIDKRQPDPRRMNEAYFRSAATLNLIRAFIQGGYSDISNWFDWSNHFFCNSLSTNHAYNSFMDRFNKSIQQGIYKIQSKKSDNIYISHEALLLDYEEAFTRLDTTHGGFYDTSAHFLWIGERTRNIGGAHIEFCRGIGNPIGIKVGPDVDASELVEIIHVLNPDNLPGKVNLIIRMGREHINHKLPALLEYLKPKTLNFNLFSDPMHGNTFKFNDIKVRRFDDILSELISFFHIVRGFDYEPKGLHLEMTSENVTECIGGISSISLDDLNRNYSSKVDPRLNAAQALELVYEISRLINKEY